MATKSKKMSESALNDVMKAMAKSWGEGITTKALAEVDYEAIPTGHDDLDCVLTNGASGIYLGGVIELFGGEGSGKSSLAMRAVGNAQKAGHACCWVDAESGFSPDLAMINGIDLAKLWMPDLACTKATSKKSDSKSGSFFNSAELLKMVYDIIMTNGFGLIVVDSVAGMIPERFLQVDADPNSSGYAELARDMSDGLKTIVPACQKNRCSVIFINQIRAVVGNMYKKEDTPGGKALKFFASQRLRVARISGAAGEVKLKENGEESVIGHYARVDIVKNKKAPPVRTPIEVPIYYREFFPDNAKKLYDYARSLHIINMRNGTLTWKNDDGEIVMQSNGESDVLAKIRQHKLESQLANACLVAEKGDKNKKLKIPVKLPETVKDLAAKFDPKKATKIPVSVSTNEEHEVFDIEDEDDDTDD